jgi:hypothetical protein
VEVQVTLNFELEGGAEDLVTILDNIVGAVVDDVGVAGEPSVGLEVDGEYRDPDDPATGFMS